MIEVVASLAIFGMFAIAIYSLLIMGMSMYEKINFENQLRNQSNVFFTYILEELDDAIYIDHSLSGCESEAPYNCKLLFVKPDENDYIQQHELKLDNANHAILFSEDGTLTRSYSMDRDDYIFQGELNQITTNQVGLKLIFAHKSAAAGSDKQEKITLQSTIKLFHNH
jgi:hypothetical protein